jgi:hypothetical protein
MTGETIVIEQLTGAGPAYTEQTAVRFCAADDPAPGLANPCKVPPAGAGTYRSYWMQLCLNYSGDFSLINNMRFWGPGNVAATWWPGTKGRLVAGRLDDASGGHGFLTSSYQQATGTEGLDGHAIKDGTHGHVVYKGQTISVVDIDTLNEGSPLAVDTRDITVAGRSKCICLQAETYEGAANGQPSPVTLVFAVDVVGA